MKWRSEKRNIEDLHEYAKNPRKLRATDALQLKSSLDKFGQCEPIIINTDNVVIGGHQRLRLLRQMRHKQVDVCVPDKTLSEKEVEELNIRLNKNQGDWDWDILANAWEVDDLLEWGFTDKDLHLDHLEMKDGEMEPSEKEKKCHLNATFKSVDDLQDAENKISVIIDEYEGAFYKIKGVK